MARKSSILDGLRKMQEAQQNGTGPSDESREKIERNFSRGPVGAMATTLKALEERGIQDIDPNTIAPSRYQDRIDLDETIASLTTSIAESGQVQPVILRRIPENGEGHSLEVVSGRRRIAACLHLGIRVRAIVAEMSDTEALIAQGLENAEREDLSYIEQARFAWHMEREGVDRKTIQQALAVPKSSLSEMISSARDTPESLMRALGGCPGSGRDDWRALRTHLASIPKPERDSLAQRVDIALPRTERLKALLASLDGSSASKLAGPAPRAGGAGDPPAPLQGLPERIAVRRKPGRLELKVSSRMDRKFLDDLERRIPEMWEEWSRRAEDE